MAQELTPEIDVSTLEDDQNLCHVFQLDDTPSKKYADSFIDAVGLELSESGIVVMGGTLEDIDSHTADELRDIASRFEAQADAMDGE